MPPSFTFGDQLQSNVFLRPSHAVIIIVKVCLLSDTTLTVSTWVGLCFFSLFTCRCKLQLCILPMKTDLASRDHRFSFSALVPKGVPCSDLKAATPKPEWSQMMETELIPGEIRAAETQGVVMSEVLAWDSKADALRYIYFRKWGFSNDGLLVGKIIFLLDFIRLFFF